MKWGFSLLLFLMSSWSLGSDLIYYDAQGLKAVPSASRTGYILYEVQDKDGQEQFCFEDKDKGGRVLAYFNGMKEEARRKKAFLTKKALSEGGEYWYRGTSLLKKLGITAPDTNNPNQILKVSFQFFNLQKIEVTSRMRGEEWTYKLNISLPAGGGRKVEYLLDVNEEFYIYVEGLRKLSMGNGKKIAFNIQPLSSRRKGGSSLPFRKLAWVTNDPGEPFRQEAMGNIGMQATAVSLRDIPTAHAVSVVPRELQYTASLDPRK